MCGTTAIAGCALALLVMATGACSRRDIVPEHLETQVDRDLRYVEIKRIPEAYRGKLMMKSCSIRYQAIWFRRNIGNH